MSWLDRVRNALPFTAKRDTADNLWHKCRQCQQMVFVKEWEDNLNVCPRCDHHDRIGAKERFAQLFDGGLHELIAAPAAPEDPLKFRAGVEAAIKRGVPYIAITAAGGARMQEGTLSLMQMPRATVALQRLRRAGLPYVVLLTDPTTGGVTASYAMLGDVQISEPNALIGFAGQRVIENTIREKLPEGFQRAEYLLDHGMIDMVVHRKELPATLGRLIGYLAPEKAA